MPRSRSGAIRQSLGPVRSRLRRHVNTANANFTDIVLSPEVSNCQVQADDIYEIADKIRSCVSTITETDSQWQTLIAGLDEDDIADEEIIYQRTASDDSAGHLSEIEDARDILSRLDRRLLEAKRIIERGGSTAYIGNETCEHSKKPVTARLPKLSLPSFNGDYFERPTFWNIFKTNIHDQELTPSEKFAYLRGQLTGTALKSIDGIQITDANYEIALTILRERFERSSNQLVGTLYSQLKRLPTSSNRIADLLAMYDSCERIFRQLESCGENTEGNRSLTLEVFSKYPTTVVKKLMERYNVGPHSSLTEVRSAVHKYIKQSENFSEILVDLDPFTDGAARSQFKRLSLDNKQSYREIDSSKRPTTTSAFSAPSKGNDPPPRNPCYFCGEAHFNSACSKFKNAETRIRRLKEIGRCTRCLSSIHNEGECRTSGNRLRCFFCKTNGHHISPLCPKEFATQTESETRCGPSSPNDQRAPNIGSTLNASSLVNAREQTVLMTASTVITNPDSGQRLKVRVMFDSGSHRSYVTATVAEELKLDTVETEPLRISIFGSKRSLSMTSRRVRLEIEEIGGGRREILVQTTPMITNCEITPCTIPQEDLKEMKSLNCQWADDYDAQNGSIDILIGSDYFWEFLTGKRIMGRSGLFFIPSTLGLLIGGKRQMEQNAKLAENYTLLCLTEFAQRDSILDGSVVTATTPPPYLCYPDVDEYWSLERIGISDDPIVSDDEKALQHFESTVMFQDGRYHVTWPWKDNRDKLPPNFDLAVSRLRTLSKRFRSTSARILPLYNQVIEEQVQKGVIEKVPKDANASDAAIHYLSHHPVLKLSSNTTKLRIVYDASAKMRKDCPSLNDCLYRGPVILPDLCHMLIRFRLKRVAIVADVEKAFLQMCLQPAERDVTRFLWFRDPENPHVDDNLEEYRFCRVPFGVVSSPFLLGATIQHHLKQYDGMTAAIIRDNTYVDNVIASIDSVEEGKSFYREAKHIFMEAGMNLQQWCTNSCEVITDIPNTDRTQQSENKVLGMLWDSCDDTLRLKPRDQSDANSKREILHIIASIYDPLGLFQPVLLAAKCYLQTLWFENTSWDEPLSSAKQQEWRTILNDIQPLFDIRVPRCPFPPGSSRRPSLHKPDAMSWNCHLAYAKSRLAPKKRSGSNVSLPRLELLACVVGARAAKFVRQALSEFENVDIYLFTDSICVLCWLKSQKTLSVFVQNRVSEIRSLNNVEFLYVNSNSNPADIGTRGKSALELKDLNLWWTGPQWLQGSRNRWPSSCNSAMSSSATVADQINAEVRGEPVFHTLVATNDTTVATTGPPPLGIDPSRFSSFRRLLRVTSWCLKFLRQRLGDINDHGCLDVRAMIEMTSEPCVTHRDMTSAKSIWVRWVQSTKYSSVINALRANRSHPLIQQLGLAIDTDGIMRCCGRFQHADLPIDTMQPKLLPADNPITDLIIREIHERSFHAGVGYTLSQIRRDIWIPKGRAAVRKVLKRCPLCRKVNGPPFGLPKMPPWPKERVARSKPFQYVGLDYLGPVNVRFNEEIKKMWICLFTCLTIRAIHLEWVSDCSAKEFLNCVIRFVGRRGTPDQIISDNAPQFRTTKTAFDKIWQHILRDETLQCYASGRGISWKFTTELAPWQGGFYERLVGLVKSSFKAAVGRKLLSWEEFVTMIVEVEAVVNARPITYVYGDYKSGFSLHPNDFLSELTVEMPQTTSELSPHGLGEAGRFLISFWKSRQKIMNVFWDVWYSEYLLSLRERGQASHRRKKGELNAFPKIDQVVLVKESDAPRGSWRMGRITKVIISQDGAVRSAEVMLPNKHVIKRPVNHLHPLEIQSNPPSLNDADNCGASDEEFDGFSQDEVDNAIHRVYGPKVSRQVRQNIDNNLTAIAVTLCF